MPRVSALPATSAYDVVLGVHILAVVIAFGVTFAYPIIFAVGARQDPRSLPLLHRIELTTERILVNGGLVLVLGAGIFLASDGHHWSEFFVQWGIAAVVVVGAIISLSIMARRAAKPPAPAPGDDGRVAGMIDEYGRTDAREWLDPSTGVWTPVAGWTGTLNQTTVSGVPYQGFAVLPANYTFTAADAGRHRHSPKPDPHRNKPTMGIPAALRQSAAPSPQHRGRMGEQHEGGYSRGNTAARGRSAGKISLSVVLRRDAL